MWRCCLIEEESFKLSYEYRHVVMRLYYLVRFRYINLKYNFLFITSRSLFPDRPIPGNYPTILPQVCVYVRGFIKLPTVLMKACMINFTFQFNIDYTIQQMKTTARNHIKHILFCCHGNHLPVCVLFHRALVGESCLILLTYKCHFMVYGLMCKQG